MRPIETLGRLGRSGKLGKFVQSRYAKRQAEAQTIMDSINRNEQYNKEQERLEPTPEVVFCMQLAQSIKSDIRQYPFYAKHAKYRDRIKWVLNPADSIADDVQYAPDLIAENAVLKYFQEHWQSATEDTITFGFVSEAQGLVLSPSGKTDMIILIDPDDGTRIKEKSTVTMVGVPGNIPNPTFADIQFAVTTPLQEDSYSQGSYYTKKIDGVDTVFYKHDLEAASSVVSIKSNNSLSATNFSFGYESYSASPDFSGVILRHLLENGEDADDINIQVSFPSGSGSILDIILGERDIHVDPRDMLFKEFTDLPVKMGKNPKGAYPMDVFAPAFILKALGGEATKGNGESLDNHPLWKFRPDGKWSDECQLSIVAARTPELHTQAMKKVNKGMQELRQRYSGPNPIFRRID